MAEGGTDDDLPSSQEPQLRPVDITPSEGWDNFYHWLCCVCVVTFDLELGQALEVRYKISPTRPEVYYRCAPLTDGNASRLCAIRHGESQYLLSRLS